MAVTIREYGCLGTRNSMGIEIPSQDFILWDDYEECKDSLREIKRKSDDLVILQSQYILIIICDEHTV